MNRRRIRDQTMEPNLRHAGMDPGDAESGPAP